MRVTARIVALIAMTTLSGCSHARPNARPEPPLPLVVQNYGFFDVTVYAIPSGAGSNARTRLALVSGSSKVTIQVPRRGRQASGALVLMLHAVGARSSWVSPALNVPEGSIACLDIYSDTYGDVSRSVLYASTGDGSGDPASTEVASR